MLLEDFRLSTKGDVEIYTIDSQGNKTLAAHINNAITASAKQVLANILAGTSGADQISDIGLFITTDTPANRVVRPVSFRTLIDVDRVQFDAIYEPASFTGTVVAADISSPIGTFAKVTALSFTKQPAEGVLISWKVKIL